MREDELKIAGHKIKRQNILKLFSEKIQIFFK